uniref:Uncharacterized protein n=1 Tax=Arundo donax TaxID=35708 RepID=A0A0A9HCF7_ARUDO
MVSFSSASLTYTIDLSFHTFHTFVLKKLVFSCFRSNFVHTKD